MTLSERIKTPPTRLRSGFPCSVGALLDQLKGTERAAFVAMLGTAEKWGWPAREIHNAVTAEGHTVSFQQINKHRGGSCRCPQARP